MKSKLSGRRWTLIKIGRRRHGCLFFQENKKEEGEKSEEGKGKVIVVGGILKEGWLTRIPLVHYLCL